VQPAADGARHVEVTRLAAAVPAAALARASRGRPRAALCLGRGWRADDNAALEDPALPNSPYRRGRSRLAAAAALALAACAVASPVSLRLQVTTAADWADLAALQRAAAEAAGTTVRDVAGIAPRRFALTLDCPDAVACDASRERLRASALVTDVADDRRERPPPSPHPPSSR
jgi:hypothetical protein